MSGSSTYDWQEFTRCQKIIHAVYLDLCKSRSEKEIYKGIVEAGKLKLDIDRIGILLFDIKNNVMLGNWGTDENGVIIDQSDYVGTLEHDKHAVEALAHRDYVYVNYDFELRNRGDIIGQGWNALASFYDGDEPIGWVACDNFLTHQPLYDWKREIIGELGRITGQLVSRFRQQDKLQKQLEKRSLELAARQKQLIESEKLASMGSLVAGVAHELNTPLGVALTAISFISDQEEQLLNDYKNGTLGKSELVHFLESNLESSALAMRSLEKANMLLSNFKQLSHQDNQIGPELINVSDVLDTIFKSIKSEFPEHSARLINKIAGDLVVYSSNALFLQVFNHLIRNSFIHGFSNQDDACIFVRSDANTNKLKIVYEDNGVGISDSDLKHIFDPFFTTKRLENNVGLGLSIIYNLISKADGSIAVTDSKSKGLAFELEFPSQIIKDNAQ